MKLDVTLLKKVKKTVGKWSMIIIGVLSSILVCKVYRYTYLYEEDFTYVFRVCHCIREFLDALDGWSVFSVLGITFLVTLIYLLM